VLVSPTEPDRLRAIGHTSSVAERFGSDFLTTSLNFGLVGVQRKEIADLAASVRDGRLTKQLGQMKTLGQAALLVEGDWQWNQDGWSLAVNGWSRMQVQGLLCSIQSRGCWILTSPSLTESITSLQNFEKWVRKAKHTSLLSRPTAPSLWGTADNREWGIYFLMGIDGFGPQLAQEFYDTFAGVPLAWTVTEHELRSVKGIGKERARRLMALFPALNQQGETPCSDSRVLSQEAAY